MADVVKPPPIGGTPSAGAAGAPASRPMSMIALRSIASRFVWIGLTTVTGILAARALQPQGRGELAAMILWPTLVGGATTFGLPTALVYHVRREPAHQSAFAGSALLQCFLITLVATAVAWPLIPNWLRHHPPDVVWMAQLCLLLAPVYALANVGRAAWEAKGHFGRSNLSQLLPPLVVIAGLGVLFWLDRLTPTTAAAVYVLGGIPTFIWILVTVARDYRPRLRGAGAAWRRLFHYGGRSYGVDIAGILSVHLDQALAVGLLSSAAMGIYAVALNLARVVAAANSSVAMVVFPRVVGLERHEMARAVSRSARMGSIAAGLIGITVLVAGPFLLRWLYGPLFLDAMRILPILICQVIIAGLVYMLLQAFLAAGRPGVATAIQLTGLAVSVPLSLVLIPRHGLVGASLSLLIAAGLRLVMTLVCYRAVLRLPLPRLWLNSADLADLVRYATTLVSAVRRPRQAGAVGAEVVR